MPGSIISPLFPYVRQKNGSAVQWLTGACAGPHATLESQTRLCPLDAGTGFRVQPYPAGGAERTVWVTTPSRRPLNPCCPPNASGLLPFDFRHTPDNVSGWSWPNGFDPSVDCERLQCVLSGLRGPGSKSDVRRPSIVAHRPTSLSGVAVPGLVRGTSAGAAGRLEASKLELRGQEPELATDVGPASAQGRRMLEGWLGARHR